MIFSTAAHEWLARSLGASAQSLSLTRMKGSTSSSVFLVQCTQNATPCQFVLRVLDNAQWLADEPDLAAHEAAALEEARKAGLPAPRLIAYASHEAGFGAPVVLMSFLEGSIDLRPGDLPRAAWLAGLAEECAAIHRHTAPDFAWRFSSWVDRSTLRPPTWTRIPHVWKRAIERVLGEAPEYDPVFIHRDYHPTNVLWHDGVVSGVVDWINACRGPAGADVAHCRSNLALMFGAETADQFLQAYCNTDKKFKYDPYWDLDSVLDGCLPQPGYYPPWQDFGLGLIAQDVLNQRLDAYIEQVMHRT